MVIQVEPSVRIRRMGVSDTPLRNLRISKGAIPLSKLAFDKVFAVLALIFFAPFLICVAAVILLTEGGPVLFGHERVGLGGRKFRCLKFRTMCLDADQRLETLLQQDLEARAEWQTCRKLTNDPRISKIGGLLRKTSLDELPQFWNVLKGEMSVVGPRPVVEDEAVFYGPYFRDYITVLPGITGAWQVSGRSDTTYEQRVALDVDYVRNRSFIGDVVTVLKTVSVIVNRTGAK